MENNRYNNGKVYKIIDNTEKQYFYIGSTTSTLSKRLWKHKQHAKENPNQKVYKYFSSINWDVNIILISEHHCENKDQLRREEDLYIRKYISDPRCLNSRREIITYEEKLQLNIDNYYKNIEYFKAQSKIYREENKQKIEEKMKPYREVHKKEKAQYDKMYKEKNKEKIKEKESIHNCECGGRYTYKHKARHDKTKKHLLFIENNSLN